MSFNQGNQYASIIYLPCINLTSLHINTQNEPLRDKYFVPSFKNELRNYHRLISLHVLRSEYLSENYFSHISVFEFRLYTVLWNYKIIRRKCVKANFVCHNRSVLFTTFTGTVKFLTIESWINYSRTCSMDFYGDEREEEEGGKNLMRMAVHLWWRYRKNEEFFYRGIVIFIVGH